tara:strand:- start:393 stop:620 length:228 start_codon:yes stop_codon:yes gene_type:complete
MKITMKKDMVGASNPQGTETMVYQEGKEYEMSAPWQSGIADAFVDAGFAQLETKVVEAEEKKKTTPRKRTVKKKA